MKIRRGDKVIVLTGANKGKIGNVLKVIKDENKVIVEGVNIKKKHQRNVGNQKGGIVEVEAPIHVSNVAFYDEKAKKGTRIGFTFDKKGKKIRVAKASGSEIK